MPPPGVVEVTEAGLQRERAVERPLHGHLLVEQHARLALDMTDEAIALVRGRIVVQRSSRALADEPALLEQALAIDHRTAAGQLRGTPPASAAPTED